MFKRMVRSALRRGANAVGYQTRAICPDQPSSDIMRDLRILIGDKPSPVLFDVGANIGQTVDTLLRNFPSAQVHAFEPGGAAFGALTENCIGKAKLNNLALAREARQLPFFENSSNLMSSFLPLGPEGWGEPKQTTVKTTTLDLYCAENNVAGIDLLKIDTQGYEIEILSGAQRTLQKTELVFLEVTLHKLYENLPSIGQVMEVMISNGFELVNFYDFHYRRFRLGWMDVLFAKASEP